MLTLKKPSIVDKSEQAIIEQIKKITNRMKRPSPTVLMLPGGDVFELRNCALERFAKGADFRLDDWHMLGGSLVHRRDTDFNLVLSGFENLQGVFRLQAGQKLFHISSGCNSRNPKAGESSWYLQMFEGSSTKVKTFATRQLYSNLHEDIGGLGWVIRYDVWKLSVESHQETSLARSEHEPFQDAILFDMLLDLAIGEFKPHTRTIEDGPPSCSRSWNH